MRVRDCCNPDVETIHLDAPVRDAMERMHEKALGSLVVVDENDRPSAS